MAMQPQKWLKLIGIGVGFLILLIVLKGMLLPAQPNKNAHTSPAEKADLAPTTLADTASSDTANETLKALAAQVEQVNDQNKAIIENDKKIQSENQQAIQQMQQTLQDKIQQIEAQKLTRSAPLPPAKTAGEGDYPIGGNTTDNTPHHAISWVDDLQANLAPAALPNPKMTSSADNALAIISPAPKPKSPTPRYTIPANSTLFDSTTFTGLIGRIPINGVVRDPYPIKVIVGKKDLAANGIYIPDIEGIVVSGIATGDMALSCVRGSITSLTFVFQDGRISTTEAGKSSSDGSLGYISTTTGNPCVPGHFYTNAPTYLTGNILLGAAQGAAGAYSQEQTTNSTNYFGGTTSTVTGSPGKYVLGQAGMNAAAQAQAWWAAREQNSFDAVYVPPNTPITVNITQEIALDYNPTGRKVAYDNAEENHVNRTLD